MLTTIFQKKNNFLININNINNLQKNFPIKKIAKTPSASFTNKIQKKNKTQNEKNFLKIPNKKLYYDNLKNLYTNNNNKTNKNNNNNTRNLDFILNLGYNNTSSLIEKDISTIDSINFLRNKKLIENIKSFYTNLLESIVSGDVNTFDEILEKNLKFNLLNDLIKFSKKNYTPKISNENSPIEIKFLSFNEIFHVEIDREKNIKTPDFILAPFKKNKFILANSNTYKIKENKTIAEIENEKKIFFSSDFVEIANNHFLESLKEKFKVEYCKLKLKQNASDEDVLYLIKIMKNLDDCELKSDTYSVHLKNEFGDYYKLREKFYFSEKEKVELYEYFKENMPMKYKHFFEKNSQKSLVRNFVSNFRRIIFEKIINPRKYILGKKSVYVIDLEIFSKKRLEFFDENGENILLKYGYKENFLAEKVQKLNSKTTSGIYADEDKEFANNNDNEDYDDNYVFKLPKSFWDFEDENFVQKHTMRIEVEKLNKRLFTSRLVLKSMKITDIDLALKGNRHVKIVEENKLKK